MPYDNDLAPWRTPIIQMLTQGARSEQTFVAVEADGGPSGHLTRTVVAPERAVDHSLRATDSSSSENLRRYLEWAAAEVSAERWALIVLGHSGGPEQISPDAHPGGAPGSALRWMRLEQLDREIQRFAERTGLLELLFLQNCCNGALEVHYSVGSAARYTLSSQLPIGVPNYYYEGVLRSLASEPDQDGLGLAEAIMRHDRPDMFEVYAVTDNSKLDDLAREVNTTIDVILSSGPTAAPLDSVSYSYGPYWFADLVSFLELAGGPSMRATSEWGRICELVGRTVPAVHHSPRARSTSHCGLSVLVPRSQTDMDRYRHLEAWRDIRLPELFAALSALDVS
jgi:hypothetical protein